MGPTIENDKGVEKAPLTDAGGRREDTSRADPTSIRRNDAGANNANRMQDDTGEDDTGTMQDNAGADDADRKAHAIEGVVNPRTGRSHRYSYKRLLALTLNKAAFPRCYISGRLLVPRSEVIQLRREDIYFQWDRKHNRCLRACVKQRKRSRTTLDAGGRTSRQF